jgi:hypothetical protein
MKVSRRRAIPAALACVLILPVSAQAANWTSGEGSGGDYEITNTTANPDITPLRIEDNNAAGTDDTLVISAQGNLGLGSTPPSGGFSARFYIYDETPEIELDDWDNGRTWNLFADGGNGGSDPVGGIGFADITEGTNPFYIQSTAPTDSFFMDTSGFVGLGTSGPTARLHLLGDSVAAVEELFILESSTSPQQVFLNSSTSAKWFFAMTSTDEFKISFAGTGKVEARFQQNGNLKIAGAYQQISDRNSKENINEIDGKDVLERVAALPISTWEYKSNNGVKHLGPMSQDFYAAFGLGDSPTTIATIDSGGVALAAIKALKHEKDAQIEQLKDESQTLDVRNASLHARLEEQAERMSGQSERIVQLEMALAEILRNQSAEVQVGSLN